MATRSVTFACIVSAALSQSCAGDDAPARNHGGSGSFAFAHVYSDHMVLQRAPLAASIWGWGSPGSTINVNLTDATDGSPIQGAAASAQVNVDGTWRALLPPQPASEAPVNVTATDTVSGASIGFGDVLFGDVYVCSGQSNMAFSVSVPLTDPVAEAKIAEAYRNDPGASLSGSYVTTQKAIDVSASFSNVRFMVVGNKHDCADPIPDYSPSPANTSLTLAHAWQKPAPETIGGTPDVMGGNGVGSMSATCYFFGVELWETQQIPIGLMHSSYGGSAIEDWIDAPTLGNGQTGPCPGAITSSMGVPTQQWNGQIRPLVNTTIKGVVWYQGESNDGQDELYACRFEQMMRLWRTSWYEGTGGATDPNFQFGVVQIGPKTNRGPAQYNSTYAIRMGQTADFGYAPNTRWPNTFMAAAFDLANPPNTKCFSGCIHIFNKQAVAHRLAVAARATIYNDSSVVSFSGPRPLAATISTDTPNAVEVTRRNCASQCLWI
eukprot:INCI17218.2.p1 GENE.INCI17218.2~~INCI17218.2.p1  ORF type:complete len:516 (-),score=65.07 INCI17218.2:453-1928(-)